MFLDEEALTVSLNGAVVALRKCLTMVQMLIALISSWWCILNPFHAQWIINLYNYLTLYEGRKITSNGRKAAYIEQVLIKRTKGLDPLDPFASINSLSEEVDSTDFTVSLNTEVNSFFISKNDDDDDNLMMIMMIHGWTKFKNP